jgi:hypothetical protein
VQISAQKFALQGFETKIGYTMTYSGAIHGIKEILAHPWFGKNSYKNFLDKKVAPPITFDSVGRIDLDRHEDKQKKEVEDIQKIQKFESSRFKR